MFGGLPACRLLLQGATSEPQLWSVARVMSAREFGQLAEERSLSGACGYPLCSRPVDTPHRAVEYHIDAIEQQVCTAEEDGAQYCQHTCAAAATAFALRLGSDAQALHRFQRLWEELQRRRAAAAQPSGAAVPGIDGSGGGVPQPGSSEPAPASALQPPTPSAAGAAATGGGADVKPPRSVLKEQPSDFAAGSRTAPVMLSKIKASAQPASFGVSRTHHQSRLCWAPEPL